MKTKCDFCGKRLKEDWPYALKLYRRFSSKEFFIIYEICDRCAKKIKSLKIVKEKYYELS